MSLRQDASHGFRMLRKSPWFTAASVVVLALGIGATTAVFSLVDAAFLRPLPLRDANQLVLLWERSAQTEKIGPSVSNFLDWQERNKTLAGIAASTGIVQFPLMDDAGGLPEAVALDGVTTNFFDVLGVPPLLGRTFNAEDERATTMTTVVISERLWRTRFNADPGIVGRSIRIGSPPRPVPVVGVVPSTARVLGATDAWEHLPLDRDDSDRGDRGMLAIGRVKPGVTIDEARSDLSVVAADLDRRWPATNKGWTVAIEPMQEAIVGEDLRRTSLALGGVVLFVLLLACANVANLILARGVGRAREIAVRAALGATQLRIASQLLVESAIVGIAGGVLGLGVGWGFLEVAPSLIPAEAIPESITIGVDWRVAIFAAVISLLTSLVFGLAPAWQAARVPMVEAMHAGGRGSSDRAGRLRQSLAVVEIAAALLLVTGAGLLVRTLISLDTVDAGYRGDNVVTMAMRVPVWKMRKAAPGELASYWRSIEEEIGRVPGVRVAALASDVPLDGLGFTRTFTVPGDAAPDPANLPIAHYQLVSPRFFEAFSIPLLRGRAFTARDTTTAPPVCIVNEEFVKRYFAGRDPLRARVAVESLALSSEPVTREIVGVVRQVKTRPDESSDNALQIYVPLAQNSWMATTVVARTLGDPMRTLPAIKSAIARADATQAVSRVRTMRAVEAEATARPRFRAQLVTAFAVLATVLASVGIFSVVMFMVQQRTREFSIRLAVGASAGDVLRLVIGSGLKLTAVGLGLGLGTSMVLARFIRTLLFGVGPLDPVTFVAAPGVLALVTMLACVAPAVRAMRADPAETLRSE